MPQQEVGDQHGSIRIIAEERTRLSPWVTLQARSVAGGHFGDGQVYHSLVQSDYLAILAHDTQGRIPLVRQYRPAVGGETWELPAGMLEAGEDPAEAALRELAEEVGHSAPVAIHLGELIPDTARLANRQQVYAVPHCRPLAAWQPEPGIAVQWVSWPELLAMVRSGGFRHALHLAAICLAQIDPRWDPRPEAAPP